MWPGTGHVQLGGPSPGGVVWLPNKSHPIVAREPDRAPRLYPASTKRVFEPLFTSIGHPPTQTLEWWEDIRSHFNVSFADSETFSSLVEEACSVDSPAAVDPCQGKRVLIDGDDVVLADRDLVTWIKMDTEPLSSWVGSPIMQLLPQNVIRTCRGILWCFHHEDTKTIYEGETVDAHLRGSDIIILTVNAEIRIRNIAFCEDVVTLSMERGSVGGWGRVRLLSWGILWCNRVKLGVLMKGADGAYHGDWVNILEFPDHEREIRALWACETDAFVLTTTELVWIDLSIPDKRAILSIEHVIHEDDRTLDLNATLFHNLWIITLSSAMRPLTLLFSLGRTSQNLPCSFRDPYFVPCWPTIMPQSHAVAIKSEFELEVYFAPFEGGLYKQVWTLDSSIRDTSHPQPTPVDNTQASLTERRDWVKKQPDSEIEFWNLANLHHYIYNLELPALDLKSKQNGETSALPFLGYTSKDDLSNDLSSFWLKSVSGKPKNILHRRERALEHITDDLSTLTVDLSPTQYDHSLSLEAQDLLHEWQDDTDNYRAPEDVYAHFEDPEFLTQLPSSSQPSQPEFPISASQPLPEIRETSGKKKRKKHKRVRRGEGFV